MPVFLVILSYDEDMGWNFMVFNSIDRAINYCNETADTMDASTLVKEINLYSYNSSTGDFNLVRRYI